MSASVHGPRRERSASTARRTPTNYFRTPYGPGWALVGDAGLAMDPVTGQGISDALRDAELLAGAITDGLGGRRSLEAALHDYQGARDRAVKPMYDFTLDVASMAPPKVEQRLLFEALERDPQQTQRFLAMLAGALPIGEFFSPSNLRRLIGLRGFAKIAASRLRSRRSATDERPRPGAADELHEIIAG